MKKAVTILAGVVFVMLVAFTGTVAHADKVASKGTFEGASDHITTGGVSIVTTANGGAVIILDTNFSLDGAPDPRVGLGKGGKYDSATDAGKLVNLKGIQAYVVPAGVDVASYDEVYIWCRKFSVPLGVAKVN